MATVVRKSDFALYLSADESQFSENEFLINPNVEIATKVINGETPVRHLKLNEEKTDWIYKDQEKSYI